MKKIFAVLMLVLSTPVGAKKEVDKPKAVAPPLLREQCPVCCCEKVFGSCQTFCRTFHAGGVAATKKALQQLAEELRKRGPKTGDLTEYLEAIKQLETLKEWELQQQLNQELFKLLPWLTPEAAISAPTLLVPDDIIRFLATQCIYQCMPASRPDGQEHHH